MAGYPRTRSFVRAAMDAVARAGYVPVDMSLFPAGSETPEEYCRRRVGTCDVYVGVIGFRYGSLVPDTDISYTELEFDSATESGIPRLLFLLDEEAPLPPSMVDRDQSRVCFFRERLNKAGIVTVKFGSAEDLDGKILHALHSLARLGGGYPDGVPGVAGVRSDSVAENLLRYREGLVRRYRRLELEVLTPTDHEEQPPVMLRSIFIPPAVRPDAPPPELPKELWHRLLDDGEIERSELPEGFDAERLAKQRAVYREQPVRPVLEVLGDPGARRTVILGDPGSGKSTLTRYLALSLLAGPLPDPLRRLEGWLPFLVELRAYASRRRDLPTFLDYLDDLHHTENLGIPADQLERLLESEGRVVVVFDGLDEIFDPRERDVVGRQIAAFAERFPRARVVVTSRVIGYGRRVLADADFAHFTLQELSVQEIRAFVRRWYEIALPDQPTEATRRRNRLWQAIDESSSIRELAGNPLLLTVLAIIGRRQELPRERRAVYAHAAAVLVDRWDVNRYLVDSRVDTGYLDVDDKKELLRRVAGRMQSGRSGLGGNHIRGADLIREFSRYLRDRYELDEPEAKRVATTMLAQFRERNFILTLYGAEVYGFVHRAFLEYFCADDIVQRFQNKRELTPEDLVQGIVGRRWSDSAWQEVLLLVASMVDDRFTARMVEYLVREANPVWSLAAWDQSVTRATPDAHLPQNLVLAARCVADVRSSAASAGNGALLLNVLLAMLEWVGDYNGVPLASRSALAAFAQDEVLPVVASTGIRWPSRAQFRRWHEAGWPGEPWTGPGTTSVLASLFADDEAVRRQVMTAAALDPSWEIREDAVRGAARAWPGHPDLYSLLHEYAVQDADDDVVTAGLQTLREHWPDETATRVLHWELAESSRSDQVRETALTALLETWPQEPGLRDLALRLAMDDTTATTDIRAAALAALLTRWPPDEDLVVVLRERAERDPDPDMRTAALRGFAEVSQDHDRVADLAERLVGSDVHPDVRGEALEVLSMLPRADDLLLPVVAVAARSDRSSGVRTAALHILVGRLAAEAEAMAAVLDLAAGDRDPKVREAAIRGLEGGWLSVRDGFGVLARLATSDEGAEARAAALAVLAETWPDDPRTAPILRACAMRDGHLDVRFAAMTALFGELDDDPWIGRVVRRGVLPVLATDHHGELQDVATEVIISAFVDRPAEDVALLREILTQSPFSGFESAVVTMLFDETDEADEVDEATDDDSGSGIARSLSAAVNLLPRLSDISARLTIVRYLAKRCADHPEPGPILRATAAADSDDSVRRAAIEAIGRWQRDDPPTRQFIRSRAVHDADAKIRIIALQAVVVGWPEDQGLFDWLRWRGAADADWTVRRAVVRLVARHWGDHAETLRWLRHRARADGHFVVQESAVIAVAAHQHDRAATDAWLRSCAVRHPGAWERAAALTACARRGRADSSVLAWLLRRAVADSSHIVRGRALTEILLGWPDDPAGYDLLLDRLTVDDASEVREVAVGLLTRAAKRVPGARERLQDSALNDVSGKVRRVAAEAVVDRWWRDPALRPWLEEVAATHADPAVRSAAYTGCAAARWIGGDPDLYGWLGAQAALDGDPAVRMRIMEMVSENHPQYGRSIALAAADDPHWQVRKAAVGILADGRDDPEHLRWLRERARHDSDQEVRRAALGALGDVADTMPETGDLLRELAGTDPHRAVRMQAIDSLGDRATSDAGALTTLRDLAETDSDWRVRKAAVAAVARNANDWRPVRIWLRKVAETDADGDVRTEALSAVCSNDHVEVDTLEWVLGRARSEVDDDVRMKILTELVDNWPSKPEVVRYLRKCAEDDPNPDMRADALDAFMTGTYADPSRGEWLFRRVVADPAEEVREAAVRAAIRCAEQAGPVGWLRVCAADDRRQAVRRAALFAVVRTWHDEAIVPWLLSRFEEERSTELQREIAVLLVTGWPFHPDVQDRLRDVAGRNDGPPSPAVRALVSDLDEAW
ncbi:HEAT repeat domain-containing protein [Frankia sp. Mgl5]|nr:HEAT repeat domain-containing protein [Frankia sp. Mgl5]